jgi:ABC-type multidrug transport system fused ATPase/permease subunit
VTKRNALPPLPQAASYSVQRDDPLIEEPAIMKKSKLEKIPVTERPLSSWVFASSIKLQITLLLIIVITVFARVVPLEMQKKIVNEAISLGKIELLIRYCAIYLAAVLTASGLKYLINTLQSVIGQRVLAKMRQDLYHHILTLPLSFFRRTQPGMVVASLVSEIAAAGDFIGMAIAVPIINVLTLLAFGGYLFWLNPLLAAVSLAIYPMVLVLIPILQRRVNRTNRKRVDATRALSDKIAESISGIHEIHGNGTYRTENTKYDGLVNRLTRIRIIWNLYKYGVKVLNNFFTNLSPFLIFLLGGYLAIKGRLELGALVAFLSAQEKLYDPWKELLDFYQLYQDAVVRYHRTMEYFDIAPEHTTEPEDRAPYDLDGSIEVKELSMFTEGGIQLLENVSFSLEPGEQLAVVGFSGSGKSTMAQCISQLIQYTTGHILIGDKEVSEMTKKDIICNMGLVSQNPFIFSGTIEENLLYSCLPLVESRDGKQNENEEKDKNKKEAAQTENSLPNLDDMIAALQQSGIFVDVLRFGLNAVLNEEEHEELISRVIRIREDFRAEFGDTLVDYVEFFSDDQYLRYSSIAENILFGTSTEKDYAIENLHKNKFFTDFLHEADLTRPLLSLGAELTRQTVDILGNLPPENVFFEQSPIPPQELDDYKMIAERLGKKRLHQLSEKDRERLIQVALRFSPGWHKMVALSEIIEILILEGRALFRERIAESLPDLISFFDPARYISTETILNNILFGKLKTTNPKAQEQINQNIIQILIEQDLLEDLLQIGMQYQVGSKGDNLSGGQRQKLAIARVLLKKPKILIMDEATSGLDNNSQARIQNLLENQWRGKSTIISIAHRLDTVKNYDRIAVMKAGKIGEIGTYDELIEKKGLFYELVHGKN